MTRTAGLIQWKAVTARTVSNGSGGSGHASKAATSTRIDRKLARLRSGRGGEARGQLGTHDLAPALRQGHGGLPRPAADLQHDAARADAGQPRQLAEEPSSAPARPPPTLRLATTPVSGHGQRLYALVRGNLGWPSGWQWSAPKAATGLELPTALPHQLPQPRTSAGTKHVYVFGNAGDVTGRMGETSAPAAG